MLDEQIGRMLKKLETLGELQNTLVIFTSDNGPHHEGHDHEFFNSNGILKGFKRDLFEGGIRVPFIAFWKGKIEAGTSNNYVAGFQDFMPTLAEIAGIEVPKQTNGISILNTLSGKTQETRESLNWEFQLDGWSRIMRDGGFRQSARMGNWKAVRYGIQSETELYNLNEDISETINVASEHPEIVQQMIHLFENNRSETDGFPYGGVIQNYKPKDKLNPTN